ncbi:MAG TPA: saccharopine dehydrogenase C-terminal domain-containing protein [Anaerolineae bacterium]|nr:saccharopine dehydrogenase C-terminal domain-containing protein [Anaerolineae bacterium]HQI87570.1 saccharopine dehydrogenase C-terminal domain-containing protein [Anaerolineae bacterium]
MNIVVFGAGLVGSAMVKDLAREANSRVTVADVRAAALDRLVAEVPVQAVCADVREPGRVAALAAEADLVICAVPGFMGFETLQRIIEAGKNVVDISFFPEDAFLLDDLAKAQGVTAVVDCGVAPGLSNIIAGYVSGLLDRVERFVCYVGGLPAIRHWPYEYKAVFSPIDVLEEYTRPARFVEYGQEVIRPALSDAELLDFPGVGTLEAFNTDGLRTLQRTLDAPFMKEKTLRYPGHINLMRIFRESGFFDTEPLDIGGVAVRPIDLTSKLLFEHWKLRPGEEDFTVMQVIVEGERAGKRVRYTYDLLDRYDRATQTTSMARTTGYTATIVARQVLRGQFTQQGICPPEFIGRTPGCYENLLSGYAERNIHLTQTVIDL